MWELTAERRCAGLSIGWTVLWVSEVWTLLEFIAWQRETQGAKKLFDINNLSVSLKWLLPFENVLSCPVLSEIILQWLNSGCANVRSALSGARSGPACSLVPASAPPQNLKHGKWNLILQAATSDLFTVQQGRPCLASWSFPKATRAVPLRAKALE